MLAGWRADTTNKKTAHQMLTSYIALHNDCLAGRPPDMHAGLHMCRGNFAGSRHFSAGGYDAIASTLFAALRVNTFYLEYDTPRAGSFAPLAHLPPDKNVVLGVVTSKFAALEGTERIVERVREAAGYVAKGAAGGRGERMCAQVNGGGVNGSVNGGGGKAERGSVQEALGRMGVSPQCGFASHEEGNDLSWGDMVAKLRLVREIADGLWPGEP